MEGTSRGQDSKRGFPSLPLPSWSSCSRLWKSCRLRRVCGVTLELAPKHSPEGAEALLLSQGCLGTECLGRTRFVTQASSAAMITGCSSCQKPPPEFHCVKVWNSGSLVGGFDQDGIPQRQFSESFRLGFTSRAQELCLCVQSIQSYQARWDFTFCC